MGRNSNTMEAVAVKVIDLEKEDIALYENEIVALRALPDHKNLPKLIGCSRRKNKAQIVMSYFPFPTLKDFIKEKGPLPTEDALYILHQLVDAINAMKKAGVAHRDIKPDNILINPNSLQIRLIDFGLSTVRSYLTEEETDFNFLGTPYYMAPDVLRRNTYKIISSDLWSAGLVFVEALTGRQPFDNMPTEDALYRAMLKPINVTSNDPVVQVIISGLLNPKESERSKVTDLLQYLRSVAPLNSPSPRTKLRWIAPLSKSLA